jgi:hypothetical protein
MTNSLPILFAAWLNDVVSVLAGLLVLVFWVVRQINDAKVRQVAQTGRPQAVAPPPQPAQADAAAGVPPAADPLRAQVDEFLRRAGQPPKPPQAAVTAKPPTRQPAARDEIVVLIDDPKAAAPLRESLADKMRTKDDAAAAQRAKPARPPQPPRERKPAPPQRVARQRPASLSEQVAERIGAVSQEFNKEVADLGERVKQADEQFDRQIQQKFDHALGSFDGRNAPRTDNLQQASTQAANPAAQLAALLATPDGALKAIVLNEILTRPVDRW